MITSDSFISITNLQKNTKNCFKDIDKVWKKIVLSNNKPLAFIVSIKEMEKISRMSEFEAESIYWSEEIVDTDDYKNFISLLKSA